MPYSIVPEKRVNRRMASSPALSLQSSALIGMLRRSPRRLAIVGSRREAAADAELLQQPLFSTSRSTPRKGFSVAPNIARMLAYARNVRSQAHSALHDGRNGCAESIAV